MFFQVGWHPVSGQMSNTRGGNPISGSFTQAETWTRGGSLEVSARISCSCLISPVFLFVVVCSFRISSLCMIVVLFDTFPIWYVRYFPRRFLLSCGCCGQVLFGRSKFLDLLGSCFFRCRCGYVRYVFCWVRFRGFLFLVFWFACSGYCWWLLLRFCFIAVVWDALCLCFQVFPMRFSRFGRIYCTGLHVSREWPLSFRRPSTQEGRRPEVAT